MNIDTDLRHWNEGGWRSSKITSKKDGRWIYFFQDGNSSPINSKEPVSYGQRYTPPSACIKANYVRPREHLSPMRQMYLLQHQHQKAPLTSHKSHRSKLYPPVWNCNLSPIPEIRPFGRTGPPRRSTPLFIELEKLDQVRDKSNRFGSISMTNDNKLTYVLPSLAMSAPPTDFKNID